MVPPTRRTLLTTASSGALLAIAGCSDGPSVSTGGEDDEPFAALRIQGLPTECPKPDYASHAVTPAPYPTPAAPDGDDAAIRLATDLEATYLRNRMVLEADPEPTATGTAGRAPPEYPSIEAAYRAKTVLQRTAGGVVVHLEYDRIVEGSKDGEATVNYYLTDSAAARAETDGHVAPGPHPTEEGTELRC